GVELRGVELPADVGADLRVVAALHLPHGEEAAVVEPAGVEVVGVLEARDQARVAGGGGRLDAGADLDVGPGAAAGRVHRRDRPVPVGQLPRVRAAPAARLLRR